MSSRLSLFVCGVALVSLLPGCQQPDPAEAPAPQVVTVAAPAATEPTGSSASARPELVLKTYTLPPAQAQRAASVLRNVLQRWPEGQAPVGKVAEAPGGQIVVVAPEDIHSGVDAFIAELATSDASDVANAPPTLEMRYWLVVATGGEGQSESLTPIAPTLERLRAHHPGSVRFELVDQVTLTSDEGEGAAVEGRNVSIKQSVWRRENTTQADIEIGTVPGGRVGSHARFETRVRFKDGQTLVLGQVGLAAPGTEAAEQQGATETLYFVVQSRVLDDATQP